MPIHLLPPDVADKIAAGEVVERPASVVKELIENSLDAGATDIRVEIREGGKRLIRVVDNGCGMPAHEAPLAVQRHATSKLQSADDLEHISTLGFRGEALAAIAAVSKLTLITRTAAEPTGIELRVEGSQVTEQRPLGTPPGSSLAVEHLFWNVPARLKFLRSEATEAGHIFQIITRYALAFPEVRFSYLPEGRLTFQSPGNRDRLQTLLKILGPEMTRQMLTLPTEEDTLQTGVRVSGFVSEPALHRANRSYIEVFVNRRYVQDRHLAFAVIQAYHTLLPTGRFPIALLFVNLAPDQVDVNVHPTKAEVRFQDASLVFRAVQRAVQQTLLAQAPVPDLHPAAGDPTGWAMRRRILIEAGQAESSTSQIELELYRQTPDGAEEEKTPKPALAAQTQPLTLPPLRAVGQIAAMYLVAEGPEGLYLVDQHAAHERILYEQIEAGERQPVARQQLLTPLAIELGSRLAGLIADQLDVLEHAGFTIEPFGSGSFLLRAVPAFMGKQDPQRLLEEVAESLGARADLVGQEREEAMVKIICKRLAIKAGQVLSLAEQRQLLNQLEACQNPRTCPHGRPTILHFSAGQLERQFGRDYA